MELKLNFPFKTAAGKEITTLTLRRLKVRDIKAISEQSQGDAARMESLGVARVVDMIPEDLEEMDAADYQTVKRRFLDILGIA
ncbi:phage tail assembly protein [Trinickia sp. YCB016]